MSATEFAWPDEVEVGRTRQSLHRWLAERYPADESTLERVMRSVSERHTRSHEGEHKPEGV